jgi:Flp pilus assembly protein CpaB
MKETFDRFFKNRSGAVIVGVAAAVLAVILLLVYLSSYRSSVNSGKRLERVLVATKVIPQGTSAKVIAANRMYIVAQVQQDQLQPLAIDDPVAIQDRVAAADIFPGQQLTQGDFTTESATSIPYSITGRQRAISLPVDSSHGMIGQVAAGNFVDVYVGVNGTSGVVTLLASDILVLQAPGSGSANAVLRINTSDAAKFAFASDNTRVWLILRPQVGPTPTPPQSANLATLLAGGK